MGGIATLTNAGLTTISPSTTRPALTAPDREPRVRGLPAHRAQRCVPGQGRRRVRVQRASFTKAATIHDGSAYGQALQQVFADEFTALGGTITVQEAVQKRQTDMKLGADHRRGDRSRGPLLADLHRRGWLHRRPEREVAGLETVVLIGSDGMFSADFVKAAGPTAQDMYLSSPNFSAFQAGYADLLAEVRGEVRPKPPQAFHAHGYDATNILFDAIEKVATTDADGTTYVPKGALRDAIYATTDFQGSPASCPAATAVTAAPRSSPSTR